MQDVKPFTAFEDFKLTTPIEVPLEGSLRSLAQQHETDWLHNDEALKQAKAELKAKIEELGKANARIAELEKQLAKQSCSTN